ncbi:MAG: YqgE/AlgH family protein [Sediminibacterium sp.]
MDPVTPGILLISDPFLKDPNFKRTVVLLCEHQDEGSFGFVLNKTMNLHLNDIVKEAEGLHFQVYDGGPVQKDTLHFLHQRPELVTGGMEVTDGIYWGGDFAEVLSLLRDKRLHPDDIRFFVGYSGWGEGQLNEELALKSWITCEATRKLVFRKNTELVWKEALNELGGEYRQMVNYPIDPQLN